MINFSYISLFLFFELFSFFLNDNKQFYIKVVSCNIHIIDNTKSSDNPKEYIYLGKNYKDEEEQKKENYNELNYFSSLSNIPDKKKGFIDEQNSLRKFYDKQFLRIGDFFYSQCNQKFYSTKIVQLEYLCKKNNMFTRAKINENNQIEKKTVEELINNYGYILFSDIDKKTANEEISLIVSPKNNGNDICSNNEIPLLYISTVCETKKRNNDDNNDKIIIKSFFNKDENILLTCNRTSINILSAYYISENTYYKDDILDTTNKISECCNGFNECSVPSILFYNMIKHKKEGKTNIGNNPFLLIEYKCNSKNLKKNLEENSKDINYPLFKRGNKCSYKESKLTNIKKIKHKPNYEKKFQNIKNLSHFMLASKQIFNPFFLRLKEKIKMSHILKNNKENSNVLKKRKTYFFVDNKKGNIMLNNLLLHNTLNNYKQTERHKVFFNNHLTKNKKDDFKIYKVENRKFNKLSKSTTFLELSKEHLGEIEDLLAKDESSLNLPFKNPIADKINLLENDSEWIITPRPFVSCRETSCPNSYEMCVPMFIDEKKFFSGKRFKDILAEILGKDNLRSSYSDDDPYYYFHYFTCVCKKQASDNFCDESVE
ncbi:conserved Plasmodium protein, unknown function [Plasmodium gallinaceum]|uniref:6-cysteine protein n=1 Tax=Plasmodium gallinaceum TaxID=5849 RepID=A0A1J1GLG0_PLAGA|nr:conserved Plasmodium protein, unknown function [Plasmodium gallinaceum]CRG93201.1 conserved Plasmodium protein, unknown function [Plasmodium gallinaceum]